MVVDAGRGTGAAHARRHRPPVAGLLTGIALLSLALGAGAYPLARRLTGRLERLQSRVDALGAGDLSARVDVEGNDEVAELAKRFNHPAQRIEQLVTSQRTMLANVSHELRSPLARMRMATELLGAEVSGVAVSINGDVRTLRRLLPNLLHNASRHAGGTLVEVIVAGSDGAATVADRGPGVPVAEQERIFEPFYRLPGTRESGDGVGLGLALVRQIAHRHAGEVTCGTRAGGGSEFRVVLAGLTI